MGTGDSAGGSLALAGLVDKYGEDLIPDLKYYYGIDLRDLFSEDCPISPRWALLHAHHLPMESSTVAEARGGSQFRGWGPDRYMTARLIDSVSALRYITILANRDPKKKLPQPPDPYPIPDKRQDKKTKDAKPGSFAFIANQLIAKGKKRREGGG